MPLIKYRSRLEQICRKPVFGPEDLQKEGLGGAYAKKLLHMLAAAGRVKRIERGKYTRLDDPVAVAAHMTEPCYLSLWTAMSIRGLTTQIPFAVEVVTPRRRFNSRIDFEGTPIIFRYIPSNMMFGYENIIWKENIRIAVAKTEKIIIDAVYFEFPKEEIMELVKGADTDLLKAYAKLTGDKKLIYKIKEMISCLRRKK